MKKRRNSNTRIKPPSNTIQSISYNVPPFHEMFPIKLTHQDGKEVKSCYFTCKEHLQTYVKRYKLKKDQVKIEKTLPKVGEN